MKENTAHHFMQALLSLDRLSAKHILEAHTRKHTPMKSIEEVIVSSLEKIGDDWQNGRLALSQVYMSGRICEELVEALLPPGDPDRKNQPRIAICVLSDHHKLGKIIVSSHLRASGYEIKDYDTIDVDELVERVKTDKIEILLISVLMLPSALKIKKVAENLANTGYDLKIIVGGAPFRFDDRLWQDVGAYAMCRSASDAVSIIQDTMGVFDEFR